MIEYIKKTYGYYVCSDSLFDYWMIDGLLYPTMHKYLEKDYGYRFQIEDDFCYPYSLGRLTPEITKHILVSFVL